MPSAHDLFKTDPNKEQREGVELKFNSFSITGKRAGGTNGGFLRRYRAFMRKHRLASVTDANINDAQIRELAEIYADEVLTGWSGDIGPGGVAAEYSRDNAVEVLCELRELFNILIEQFGDFKNFTAVEPEETTKNL